MYHINLSIHELMDIWGYFHFWAIMNRAAYLCTHFYVDVFMFSFLLAIHRRVEVLCHMVNSGSNHLRNCQTIFRSGYMILHSHQQYVRVPIYPYPQQYQLLFFFNRQSSVCEISLRYGFAFPWWLTMLNIFARACQPFVSLPRRNIDLDIGSF